MIYLATPYSDDDPAVREQRFQWACQIASDLMIAGRKILSPIAHTHPIAEYGLPKGWEFWKEYDTELILFCDEVWVVKMPGWEESVGVQAEIELAKKEGKPVKFLEFTETTRKNSTEK